MSKASFHLRKMIMRSSMSKIRISFIYLKARLLKMLNIMNYVIMVLIGRSWSFKG